MLESITIAGFKSIEKQTLSLKPLTIVTGLNSTGKSSVIQSILLFAKLSNRANYYSMAKLTENYSAFREVRNRYFNSKAINIQIKMGGHRWHCQLDEQQTKADEFESLVYEPQASDSHTELFYLNANRMGQEPIALFSDQKVGHVGEFLFGSYEKRKSHPLVDDLCKFEGSRTMAWQLRCWLSQITGITTELKTEQINQAQIRVSFDSDDITDINPHNTGAGFSFVAKILILCLLAKKDDLVIIENPEIHLHPKVQAQLGVFFAFMANAGVQIVLETHCEHLINKVCYQVYDEKLNHQDVVIHYKGDIHKPFELVEIDDDGQYLNSDKQVITFPSGFFDASLNDLLEMR
jgi:predicted ATPase